MTDPSEVPSTLFPFLRLGDSPRYRDALVDVADALREGRAWTARQLAERFGVTRPTAYDWLRCLRRRGLRLERSRVRIAGSGPEAIAYRVAAGSEAVSGPLSEADGAPAVASPVS